MWPIYLAELTYDKMVLSVYIDRRGLVCMALFTVVLRNVSWTHPYLAGNVCISVNVHLFWGNLEVYVHTAPQVQCSSHTGLGGFSSTADALFVVPAFC